MTSRDFCYWLMGYFEINDGELEELTPVQIRVIQQHLRLVFAHELDALAGDKKVQEKLNEIHSGHKDAVMRC